MLLGVGEHQETIQFSRACRSVFLSLILFSLIACGYRTVPRQKFTGQASGKVIDYTDDKGGLQDLPVKRTIVDTKTIEDDNMMYNGKHLQWDDLCTRDREELVELCEENPVGVAHYIHTNITGGN